MNHRIRFGLPAFLAALATLTGCSSTTVNTVEPASPVAQRELVSDRRVLTDPSLNRKVRIVGLNTASGPEGFLKVQVEVVNVTSRVHSFTYQIEWFDENGIIIQLPSATSLPRSIEGWESLMLTATAPTPRAKDFRVKFLEPTTR